MKFTETPLAGLTVVDLNKLEDERGFFARTFCQNEFQEQGLAVDVVQCNTSFNAHRGTVRGLHIQIEPHAEDKLVRCVRGTIFDVALDMRLESATYLQWYGAELSADNGRALFIPRGFAHGFQTLRDNSEVLYQMSAFYAPESSRGLRWNDPAYGIEWPLQHSAISERDQAFPLFHENILS